MEIIKHVYLEKGELPDHYKQADEDSRTREARGTFAVSSIIDADVIDGVISVELNKLILSLARVRRIPCNAHISFTFGHNTAELSGSVVYFEDEEKIKLETQIQKVVSCAENICSRFGIRQIQLLLIQTCVFIH
jgi:hypothetical protein